jgi:hypothetical protein
MLPRAGSFALLLLVVAMPAFLAGCLQRTVVGGEEGAGGLEELPGSTVETTSAPATAVTVTSGPGGAEPMVCDPSAADTLAYMGDPPFDTPSGIVGPGAPVGPADAVNFFVTSEPVACEDPWAACIDGWELMLRLPPDVQAPGVYEMEHLVEFFCHSFDEVPRGTVEVLCVDDATVVLDLHVENDNPVQLGGTYAASLCPG